MSQKNITLYCQQGNSDKVYIIEKVPTGADFAINFAYGRRGSTLNTGTKTGAPVASAKADQIFDKLKNEKLAKGYFEGAALSGYVYATSGGNVVNFPQNGANAGTTAQASQPTGINVQLLNAIDDAELENFLLDDQFAAQEKFDGKRIALVLDGGEVFGVNRSGLRCGIPLAFAVAVRNVADLCKRIYNTEILQLIIDGEAIGDDFFAFDLLELNGEDFRPQAYLHRYNRLKAILYAGQPTPPVANLFCSDLIRGQQAKRNFFAAAKSTGAEGVVFKLTGATYEAGRPNSGGSQRKYKFVTDATCLVSGQNGAKRSVSLQVLDGRGGLIDIGNCTIPVNFDIPKFGALVEIRYLYAYRNGSLYQPVYQGERTDKTAPDAYDTLKFKAEALAA